MKIIKNESLKEYVNYKIGGITPKLYILESVKDISSIPLDDLKSGYILGAGTNILVSSSGVDKPVIKNNIKGFEFNSKNLILKVGAGEILDEVCKKTIDLGFAGLFHVSSIPGTVGGGIVMNCGASHGNISENLIDVTTVSRKDGKVIVFKKEDCKFGFRNSIFQNQEYLILEARFKLKKPDINMVEIYNQAHNKRQKTYPLIFPSAGCWFKKDWGGWKIIEKIGMVGKWSGKAVTSPMFPAFILNTGGATSDDVIGLVKEIQNKAKAIGEKMPCEIVIWKK
jgi:UDP-N-acetylmuramate dehydrogenase